MTQRTSQSTLYLPPDVDEAHARHGYNCGPAALAALLGRPVLQLRDALEPWRGYLAFADMRRALDRLGIQYAAMRKDFEILDGSIRPSDWEGRLTIIQWGGAWLKPGVHPGAALSRTHWVAVHHSSMIVYDVNGGANGSGAWMAAAEWKVLAKTIMAEVPRCDGTWTARSTILVNPHRPAEASPPARAGQLSMFGDEPRERIL